MSEERGGLRWAISGGGTGGHVTPALALGEELTSQRETVLFLGGDRGLETRLVPEAGFDLIRLPARPVAGRGPLGKASALLHLVWASWKALATLRRFRANVVLSVGGYAAVPAAAAAILLGIPLMLVEPNAIPGRANRTLARFARRVFVSFEAAGQRLGRALPADRVRSVGVPLRRALVASFAHAEPRRVPVPPFHLLIIGGSQGARQLNEAMLEALPALDPKRLALVHQTGSADRERMAEAYRRAGFEAEVVAFEPDLSARYRWADLVVCRSGALTVGELTLAGLPALLVPYPYASDDHQRENARELERAGAARVLDPHSFDGELLARMLEELLADPEQLRAMGRCAGVRARPDAARCIVEECRQLVGA
jgi:UDP-N-acetylglucosamine--N-acetylmuramyl-(pentapeptide) pyrophosphoryl-undecaprenol N-acetylglucosamine transferase